MLKKDYRSLSEKYHGKRVKQLTEAEIHSYITARMPATLAAIQRVLEEVAPRISHKVQTFLDLGAGPGTGLLAAQNFFPIQKAILIEKNPHMASKGKKLVDAEWILDDIANVKPLDTDLALFSYSLGEIREGLRSKILKKFWEKAQTLVVIEPGTPQGYQVILQVRKELITQGGSILAPCPHMQRCPMEGVDWCHFSARVQRTKEHRKEKGAQKGWEDEKFSYVAFSKSPTMPAEARIVRHPQKKKGLVSLQLCGSEGLEEKVITQKEKEDYRRARKARWGDSWGAKEHPYKNQNDIDKS